MADTFQVVTGGLEFNQLLGTVAAEASTTPSSTLVAVARIVIMEEQWSEHKPTLQDL